MTDTGMLTLRISKQLKQQLDLLAKGTKRTKTYHAAAALEEYVERQAWQVEAIQQGIAAADQGRLIAHEEVGEWIASLGRKHPKARPAVKSRL